MTDLIIIGAGPGGYELALEAAEHNLTSILIEKNQLGGTCLNVGCIPTKAYYHIANLINDLKKAEQFGITIENLTFNMEKAKARKNEIVNGLKEGINFSLNKANVKLVYGEGKLLNANTVVVNDVEYRAKYIIIATGSSSASLPGFEKALTSTEMLDLANIPKNLAVIGGGVIGIEMATIFNALGSKVDIIEFTDSVIPVGDKEITKRLQALLKRRGINFHLSSRALSFDENSLTFERKGKEQTIPCDQVLLSVGRTPNITGLGLEQVGIKYSKKGIETNSNFQTNILNVYAIGDVTGKQMLAHFATYSGYHVLRHILNRESRINFDLVPACVFTFPEVAWVGLTEEECISQNLIYTVSKGYYRANGKAVSMDETDGFIKVILKQDLLIGVHIIGKDASVLIHEMSSLMNMKIEKSNFLDFIHAHPTLSEILTLSLK